MSDKIPPSELLLISSAEGSAEGSAGGSAQQRLSKDSVKAQQKKCKMTGSKKIED
jgi:hypothetical protein